MSDEKASEALGFDQRLQRLEGIVAELEGGELDLEAGIGRYQEGIEHLKLCHRTLEAYRQRVEELTKEAEGALAPFKNDPDAGLLDG